MKLTGKAEALGVKPAIAQSVSRQHPTTGGPGSIPDQSVWDFWWKKWL
jgi:hypothetical protein